MEMASIRKLIFIFMAIGFYVGCSDVSFKNSPGSKCTDYNNDFGDDTCVTTEDNYLEFSHTMRAGLVDVLFVDDNSGSMYPEQQEMGSRFPYFINSIDRLDYRIAITTTDIKKDKGNFLKYPNGSDVLSPSTPNATNEFRQTIQRPETLACDDPASSECPSDDERGIYAVNLAIDRGHSNFFRPDAHLAIVILSDEDERSNGGKITGYPLQEYDLPETLVNKVKTQLGVAKTFSVHSVIIRPGDTACYNAQDERTSSKPFARHGFYGEIYASLSKPSDALKSDSGLIEGEIGSICSSNYTNELGDIASKLNQNVALIQLACHPVDSVVDVSLEPLPSYAIQYTLDDNNRLRLSPAAPAGTDVTVNYKCLPGT